MSIKVNLEIIGEGNLKVELKSEKQNFVFIASYIPYNSFSELIDSLIAVLTQKKIDTSVRWSTEPVEYEFQFSGIAHKLSFFVNEYPDSRRKIGTEQLIFNTTGSSLEIALSFWRSLREFQSHSSNSSKWTHSFSSQQMSKLNDLIEIHSVEPKKH